LPTLQAIKKAKKLRIPSVVTVHGVFAERGFTVNLLQKMYLRSIGCAILSAADRVICLTRSNVREIERLGCPSSKIALVPNAIDTDLFRPSDDRKDNLVVWVGRFVPEKDVESIIEAACVTVKKLPETKFLLIGYGPGKMKLEGLAKRRGLLQRNLVITGPLERERIAEILARATLFVFPSIKEGMPLALLEAMACGLPSIVADFDGVEDIVTHKQTGYTVQRQNPAQLSEGIIELLGDKDSRRFLGANARNRILKSNSWEIMTKTLDSIYCEVTNFSS
jgi:glycosyltransferase involved in cell wall biosynthesis